MFKICENTTVSAFCQQHVGISGITDKACMRGKSIKYIADQLFSALQWEEQTSMATRVLRNSNLWQKCTRINTRITTKWNTQMNMFAHFQNFPASFYHCFNSPLTFWKPTTSTILVVLTYGNDVVAVNNLTDLWQWSIWLTYGNDVVAVSNLTAGQLSPVDHHRVDKSRALPCEGTAACHQMNHSSQPKKGAEEVVGWNTVMALYLPSSLPAQYSPQGGVCADLVPPWPTHLHTPSSVVISTGVLTLPCHD